MVRLLGEFRLDGVDLRELRSRKARMLLKRLALEGGAPVHPDRLVLDLWEDVPPADPGADLDVLRRHEATGIVVPIDDIALQRRGHRYRLRPTTYSDVQFCRCGSRRRSPGSIA